MQEAKKHNHLPRLDDYLFHIVYQEEKSIEKKCTGYHNY